MHIAAPFTLLSIQRCTFPQNAHAGTMSLAAVGERFDLRPGTPARIVFFVFVGIALFFSLYFRPAHRMDLDPFTEGVFVQPALRHTQI
jgi:hypothetical protein